MSKTEITITREEFNKAVVQATSKASADDSAKDPMMGMLTMMMGLSVCKELETLLFNEEDNKNGIED